MILGHLWFIIGFCFNIYTQIHQRMAWGIDQVIKAVEAVSKKERLASKT
jgi:hypothetical protein